MTEPIPLGQKEALRLEFKAAAALQEPEIVAREIVALLNAKGGEVWVGLREEDGRAVAVDPVPDPDLAERRLLDFLVDSIEPSPSSREVEIRRVEADQGTIFRLEATPVERRQPYAFTKRGGRHFLIRVGDRLRPMSRDEVVSAFGGEVRDSSALEAAKARLLEARRTVQEKGEPRLWLGIAPAAEIELDLHDPRLEELLQNPRLSGNRTSGWSFTHFENRPQLRKDLLLTHPEEERSVQIWRNGGLSFLLPLERLYWKGEDRQIWPLTLLEYPVSAFRLAREIYTGKLNEGHRLAADLALIGVAGWKLRAGSPGGWSPSGPASYTESPDLVWEKPLEFGFDEIVTEPDRCAIRLVERVYEAFGFRRDRIPREFDPVTGRLLLPE